MEECKIGMCDIMDYTGSIIFWILYWGKGKNTTICGTNSNVFNILHFTLLDLSA